MITKRIHSQDAHYKLSPKNSGETSLNLSNEILQLIAPTLSKGSETPISFTLYRADYLKALGAIVNCSPLYISSSSSSTVVSSDPNVFIKDFQAICSFFGPNEKKTYTVNLLYRKDGRIYLNALEDKSSKFNIRHFLLEERSALEFDKIESDNSIRLKLDAIDEEKIREIAKRGNSTSTIEQYFSSYRPYITAIKSKPFLLLAGISGTGKSRIVRELARACWDADSDEFKAQKPRNFEMVQVKPNWHDSSELIGYVSRVSGQPIFVAGDFLKFIARAWEEPDVPYFLCLDEMNLAPVEQYFAEYLSAVESRKATNGNVITDPILKPVYKKERDPKTGEIIPEGWYSELISVLLVGCSEEKVFALTKQFESDGITIPQNLIVVGTVNMDETTFSFSRKVLDRAMTIEMNEVDLTGGLTNRYEQIGKLGMNELVGKAVEGVDVYENYEGVCNIAITYLKSINDVLEGTPFKVAYRTRNEVLLYVVNNLPYNKNAEGEELLEEYVIARALDEITNMKVLSRIEGDETKVSNAFLEKLEKAIKQGLENIFEGPFEKEETDDVFKSVSLAKLDEMKKRLSSGYTSFWS